MGRNLRSHRDLDVYQLAFASAMEIFRITRPFPPEEQFGLTSQIRRSSRSVCANLAEGWRKRRYPSAFVAKLSDAEAEAAETQTHLEFAVACGYLDRAIARDLYARYNSIQAMLVTMISQAEHWSIRKPTP
jgi:four helix bundle protein